MDSISRYLLSCYVLIHKGATTREGWRNVIRFAVDALLEPKYLFACGISRHLSIRTKVYADIGNVNKLKMIIDNIFQNYNNIQNIGITNYLGKYTDSGDEMEDKINIGFDIISRSEEAILGLIKMGSERYTKYYFTENIKEGEENYNRLVNDYKILKDKELFYPCIGISASVHIPRDNLDTFIKYIFDVNGGFWAAYHPEDPDSPHYAVSASLGFSKVREEKYEDKLINGEIKFDPETKVFYSIKWKPNYPEIINNPRNRIMLMYRPKTIIGI